MKRHMESMHTSSMTTSMASSTLVAMGTMPTGHSHFGTDMSHSKMGMQDMAMVFFFGHSTPLYSNAWTPSTVGQYAGTCIFLIILSAIFRGLVAVRCNFSQIYDTVVRRHDTELLRPYRDPRELRREPWTANRAVTRAVLDTILAGVSYLLMLAVMTMNVGYFLSILGGTFLGSFVVGDRAGAMAH